MRRRHVLAGAILDSSGTRILLARRARPVELAGLWELPGGKAEVGETDEEALRRELAEELGIAVGVEFELRDQVVLSDELVLIARWARVIAGEPTAREHQAVRWVDAEELSTLCDEGRLVPADTVWVPELVARLRRA
ncbi:putative NTP pyrophosphohydrolase [Gordonia polyisoprenivorans NBRC 16320 = JCM 10675]|uniref:(deoxy)nucleoside triphosphate pyrophosphohydrolase n=1 Tax=Gordonia TaxID=2053 RepID=UPI00023A8F70|nr:MULTISPECIES: NUDIX domain-containing protein [Gordonia]MDF3283746.1 NUDIX domain-containing protein [Gordonia sp. N1V]WCB35790.1 NUDIX domain-containing protein [Gordonia polyisoprenivorans]GAB21109.1 putative NTP pyrophosphohydrolase [Gordonia polyisoprenivorans NBRC 16320 = JCM 10675]